MSTKLIAALIILLVAWGGYRIVTTYKQAQADRLLQKEAESGASINPDQLSGLPYDLSSSLKQAQAQGAAPLKRWLQSYGNRVQDPRKAWIELDYCKMIFRENPQEARTVYASVKKRLPESSPVYPRMKRMERSFD